MYTSTPNVPDGASRPAFKDVTNMNGKSRKRLSNIHHVPSVQLEVDNELERSIRREHASIQKRLSNISLASPSTRSPQPHNEKEIREHFQICLKMFTENKICSKNAWNLKIIDYMRTVLESQGLTTESLQIASTTLDAGAKVYGLRVDDIHADVLKLANDMARTAAAKQALEENADEPAENEDGEDGDENPAVKKRQRKRRVFNGQKHTIARDPNSLINDVPKVESVFFQTRTDINLSCIDNLFTKKLPMNYSGYKFMLLSKEIAWPPNEERKVDPNLNFEKRVPNVVPEPRNFKICAPFNDFVIDEWDPEQEKQMLLSKNTDINEEVVFDSQGIPIPELDGSVHDIFENNQVDVFSDEEEGEALHNSAIKTNHVAHIVDFMPKVCDVEPHEYSFVSNAPILGNRLITQIWAGPSHWKLKYIRQAVGRCAGQNLNNENNKQMCKSTKKPRFQPTPIDLSQDPGPIDKTKLHKIRRTRLEPNPYSVTLPDRFIMDFKPHSLMLRPGCFVEYKNKNNKEANADPDDNLEVGDYNYDNPNDSLYCSQQAVDHSGGEDHDDAPGEDNPLPLENFLGDLINAPETIQNTYVPYALQAKKMDMRKLKVAVWETLTKGKNGLLKDKEISIQETRFSEVYKQLPCRITEKMRSELSAPLAFAALLHLCNENNLELSGQNDLKDLIVRQSHCP